MTQIITPLLAKIDASDRANQELSQGVIKAITEEAHIYKTAFEKLAEELLKRDEYIVKFRAKFQLTAPQLVPSQNLKGSPLIATPSLESEPSEASLLIRSTYISNADEINESLVQKIIQSCVEQRDLYKNAFEGLGIEIDNRDQEIQKLHEHVKALPKPLEDDKENQLKEVGQDVQNLKVGRIKAKDQDAAIQNYIFLLFIEAKNEKKEPIDLDRFNSLNDLSEEDQKLLKQIAKKAVHNMNPARDPSLECEYDLRKLFATKDRALRTKLVINNSSHHKGSIPNDMAAAKLEGEARKIFAHFFSALELAQKSKQKEKTHYSDFIFANIAFLSGNLLLAEKTYEDCRAYYATKRGPKDPQSILIQKKINQIKEIQKLFLQLLNKCQFEK